MRKAGLGLAVDSTHLFLEEEVAAIKVVSAEEGDILVILDMTDVTMVKVLVVQVL